MARRLLRSPFALVLAFALCSPATALSAVAPSPSAYADDECATFPALNTAACGPFLRHWREHGGVAQLGYPLTEVFDEVNPGDGTVRKTQFFERARFEYHPEHPQPNDVQLGLLGREQFLAHYPAGAPASADDPFASLPQPQECATFAETGQRICGPFLTYWQAHGGLAQQGFPLSAIFLELNPTDGQQYPTQYFERARFEYHPAAGGAPAMVLLGLLGSEQLRVRYPDGIAESIRVATR